MLCEEKSTWNITCEPVNAAREKNKPKTLDCTHYHTVCEEWTCKWMVGQKCFFQRIYVWRQLLPLFCLSKSHDIKCETSYRSLLCNYVCIFQGSCRVCCTKVERTRERECVCVLSVREWEDWWEWFRTATCNSLEADIRSKKGIICEV